MATYRTWIFETDAPLDPFRYWLLRHLRAQDWTVRDADVYDHEVHRAATRAHLRLSYHDDGLEVEAKIRTGLLRGSARTVADAILEAGRSAQVRVQSEADRAPPEPNG